MRLLILGGTGPTGIKTIEEALAASHTVVIYARSPGKIPDAIATDPAVTIVEGQLTDREKLTEAMQGVDAVLSALGPLGPFHPSDTPLAHAYSLVIDAMKKQNVARLIALGTASMKDEHDRFSIAFSALVNSVAIFARGAYKDVVAIAEVIKSEGAELQWTIARVPVLTNHDTKEVVAGYVGDGKTKTTLARAGFAHFVVTELEKGEWYQKIPMISSP
ncbi:NAD-P-binding protein [Fomitopsis serialis]|uniref:NAD-P-binding protein n=1 Tax=Fomitopsis serialis TaxID=139415 RepID=UPI0020084914|nr:NAD-P-binding protein [Neoantrodia serialis]KAH9921429.1 NAD-P-binding protein [Neoantrodia serialis]